MGMFDSVYFPCPTPGCDQQLEVQSKAGECILASYDPEDVPVEIAHDIGGESVWCRSCKNTFTVAKDLATRVSVRLIGGSYRPPCEYCGK